MHLPERHLTALRHLPALEGIHDGGDLRYRPELAHRRLDRGLRALASQGMSPEDMRKLDFDRLRVAQRDSALAEVKGSILLDRIADAENTEVTDQELEEQLRFISVQSREPLETLRTRLTEDGSLARIREQLRREKTRASLYERIGS